MTRNRLNGAGRQVALVALAVAVYAARSPEPLAQTVPEEIDAALERCNRLDDPRARLACLRAIFESPAPDDSGSDDARGEPDAGTDRAVPQSRRTMPRGGIDESSREGAAPAPAERAAPRSADDDFGLPPRIRDDAEQPRISSSVVWYDDVYRIGHPVFVLENGQVWQETDGKGRVEIPMDPPFGITISKGMFGDFQMKVDGKSGFMRVKRLK